VSSRYCRRKVPRRHRRGHQVVDVEAGEPVPAGSSQMRMESASVGKEVGSGRVDQTHGFIFSADETTDVGRETDTTISPDYTAHASTFNGMIDWVRIDLGDDAKDADHYIDPDERFRHGAAVVRPAFSRR
jgi:hypothetical protein